MEKTKFFNTAVFVIKNHLDHIVIAASATKPKWMTSVVPTHYATIMECVELSGLPVTENSLFTRYDVFAITVGRVPSALRKLVVHHPPHRLRHNNNMFQ